MVADVPEHLVHLLVRAKVLQRDRANVIVLMPATKFSKQNSNNKLNFQTPSVPPLSDRPDHVGTAVLAPVAELEALPEDGVVAEFVPKPAHGQHRPDNVAGRQVREDLDENLLGKTVDV